MLRDWPCLVMPVAGSLVLKLPFTVIAAACRCMMHRNYTMHIEATYCNTTVFCVATVVLKEEAVQHDVWWMHYTTKRLTVPVLKSNHTIMNTQSIPGQHAVGFSETDLKRYRKARSRIRTRW
jgi:hypothetical protein